jgi:hypothetical protein
MFFWCEKQREVGKQRIMGITYRLFDVAFHVDADYFNVILSVTEAQTEHFILPAKPKFN